MYIIEIKGDGYDWESIQQDPFNNLAEAEIEMHRLARKWPSNYFRVITKRVVYEQKFLGE